MFWKACGVPRGPNAMPPVDTRSMAPPALNRKSPSRAGLHKRLAPDGYSLGWNDQAGLHPHLHVIPRFDDEPMAGHGVRSGINDPANRRPDPRRPGTGRHMAGS
jgi:hypothetical protein